MSFMIFLSLAPSALTSWPGRGTPRNPSSSLATSISVASLQSMHMLCKIQHAMIRQAYSVDTSTSLLTAQMPVQ